MPANSTVDAKGTKSVSIMTTGHEKDRFTVMLACLGEGTKLPRYVVFKRKTKSQRVDGRFTCERLAELCLVQSWRASTKKKSPCVGLF